MVLTDERTDNLDHLPDMATKIDALASSSNPFVFKGTVTTATSSTVFAATELIGHGDDSFDGWSVYVFYDTAGTGAAPQGESQPISGYVSLTGVFTHTTFTADLAVGDEVLIMHPDATGGDATGAKQDTIISNLGVPAKDATTDAYMREVVGKKDDTAQTTVGITRSIIAYVKGILNQIVDVMGAGFVTADDSLHAISVEISEILNLTRTGADIAVTAAETSLFIDDAPTKIIDGRIVRIDTTDMGVADTYEFREYYRMESGGGYIDMADPITLTGVQSSPGYTIRLDSYRYGCKVTSKKIAGVDRSFPIEGVREA